METIKLPAIERQIGEMVYKLYYFSEEEITIVVGKKSIITGSSAIYLITSLKRQVVCDIVPQEMERNN